MSKDVLSGFGGKGFRGGSLLALAILISAYYLLYHFFSSRRSFSKVFLHYLAVVVLFGFGLALYQRQQVQQVAQRS